MKTVNVEKGIEDYLRSFIGEVVYVSVIDKSPIPNHGVHLALNKQRGAQSTHRVTITAMYQEDWGGEGGGCITMLDFTPEVTYKRNGVTIKEKSVQCFGNLLIYSK